MRAPGGNASCAAQSLEALEALLLEALLLDESPLELGLDELEPDEFDEPDESEDPDELEEPEELDEELELLLEP